MKLGEICAGYNGLGLAVEEVFGATPAWFSEFEAAPSKILAHHYPDVPNHGDMTKIDWSAVEPVDIISGGTPCQDLSSSGKRKGMTEGTRSNLWVQMREAVATIKPTYVVWENVRGAYSAGAYSEMEQSAGRVGADGGSHLRALGRVLGDLSDLGYDCQWRGLRAADVGAPHGRFRVFVLARRRLTVADHQGAARRAPKSDNLGTGQVTAAEPRERFGVDVAWGEYGPAIRRWEAALGRRAPAPTELGNNGKHRLSARFCEWMMGVPDGWIVDVPGITRNEALKAAGNGVVPQQAAAALQDMLAYSVEMEVAA